VDDVVDETSDPGVAATKLQWWRQEVSQAWAGRASHPVTQALLPLAADFGIEPAHLLAVVEGCQTDLDQTRFPDYPSLQRYCHLVAGVVGEVAANFFGLTEPATVSYAHELGLAMQLTNIIRDVGDDARRGRIYLPLTELEHFDVKAAELLVREKPWGYSSRFDALLRFQAQRAHAAFDRALGLLPAGDRGSQKPGLMMANIYRTLLREIESQGFQVLHQRTSLTPMRKLWVAARTHLRGR
jgi:phytoene synthase